MTGVLTLEESIKKIKVINKLMQNILQAYI